MCCIYWRHDFHLESDVTFWLLDSCVVFICVCCVCGELAAVGQRVGPRERETEPRRVPRVRERTEREILTTATWHEPTAEAHEEGLVPCVYSPLYWEIDKRAALYDWSWEPHTRFLFICQTQPHSVFFPSSGMIMAETRIMEVMIWVMEEAEDPVTPPHSPGVTPIFTSCSRTTLSPSRPGEGAVWLFSNTALQIIIIILHSLWGYSVVCLVGWGTSLTWTWVLLRPWWRPSKSSCCLWTTRSTRLSRSNATTSTKSILGGSRCRSSSSLTKEKSGTPQSRWLSVSMAVFNNACGLIVQERDRNEQHCCSVSLLWGAGGLLQSKWS